MAVRLARTALPKGNTMKPDLIERLLAGAVLLTSTLSAPTLALAQRAAGPGPALVPARPVKVLTVPCCRCLDGSVQTINISTGSAAWTVKPPSGPVQTASPSNHPAWTTALAPAAWLGTQSGQVGTYTFDLRFRIPNCAIRPNVTLSGAFSADNGGTVSLIPGPMTPASVTPPQGFQTTAPFSSGNLGPGNYTLRVTVNNLHGPAGMALKGTITIRCPRFVQPVDPIEEAGDPIDDS